MTHEQNLYRHCCPSRRDESFVKATRHRARELSKKAAGTPPTNSVDLGSQRERVGVAVPNQAPEAERKGLGAGMSGA